MIKKYYNADVIETSSCARKIIDEVREITANEVAKKQKQAEDAYPNILNKIKGAAKTGSNELYVQTYEVDEFTKRLLLNDGFRVSYQEVESNKYDILRYNSSSHIKRWRISW